MKHKQNNPIDEMERLQQAALAREVDEELQREKMRALWKKYRFVVFGFVAGILLLTIGHEVYYSWREKVRLHESDVFENAAVYAFTGESDKAISSLEQLAKTGKTGYADLATLKLAGIYLSQNNQDQAMAYLKTAMTDSKSEQLRNIATLTYVGHMIGQEDAKSLQALLQPLLLPTSAFAGSAAELSAALYLQNNDKENAIRVLKEGIQNQNTAEVVKTRLNQVLSALEG